MPSTTSSSLSSPWPSSTVMTPSLPTFSIASAMVLPMDSSEFAEIVPTCAMALGSLQGFERRFNSSVVTSTALSMPRLMSMGLRPEATAFRPSRMIACASTVAVVVPSPASSEFFDFGRPFGSAVVAEVNLVADLDVAGTPLSVLKDLPLADRNDLSLNGFFGRRIGNHDAARRGPILFQALHDDAVMKRTNLHI